MTPLNDPNRQPLPSGFYEPPLVPRKRSAPWWIWAILVVVIIVLIGAVAVNSFNSNQSATNETNSTSTGAIVATREWGRVKVNNARVFDAPSTNARELQRLSVNTIVAFQNKTSSGSWYERSGGGWIESSSVAVYPNESQARASLPK